jgi:hypothetical protein
MSAASPKSGGMRRTGIFIVVIVSMLVVLKVVIPNLIKEKQLDDARRQAEAAAKAKIDRINAGQRKQ